ncbi:P-loop containing nucleoside triphosphate hydrolase protein [Stachybotrys elegans]|uniref:P-loop containing nucleoside triphosphate hydrolase protein n=1 Tax=Stachybotrys elegans TaxID=80388 RepID=A0A8K0SNZ2_9HYPO|nr:P-loop containing nucleoside triphosphate hydrolase protein [Stachybotrys elegans]
MEHSDGDVGMRCEFRTYHEIPKKDGEMVVKKISDPFGKSSIQVDDSPYALVIKRRFPHENPSTPSSVSLRVNSPHILKAFRDVIGSYSTVASNFQTPFTLTGPFQMLYHYWDELYAYLGNAPNATARMHMRLLTEFMENELGPDRNVISVMLAKGQITYLTAWAIFRPGDLVYTTIMGHGWVLRCEKTVYEENTSIGQYLEVHCTYTNHDGTMAGQVPHTFAIIQKRHFGGDNPAFIAELPVYPRKFVRDSDNLEETLKARGAKFLDLMGVSVQMYEGLAQYLKEPPSSYYDPKMAGFDDIWFPFAQNGRVVLDKKAFLESQSIHYLQIKRVAEPEALLCPPHAIGFSLARKGWCRFFLDTISSVKWKEGIWNRLILDPDQKLVLQALVSSHKPPANPRNQPEQKGKGLVILLHGDPGSGKTLTAEVAAEGSRKPLISASLGDLNKENIPWVFEYELKRLLQYATLWNAVILLDEADVFLEVRDEQAGNAERNALVAVFLKELEYFSGIVFLTTNRIRAFDLAMKSRVHLALGYKSPNDETRRKIWKQFLHQIPDDELGLEDIDDAIKVVVHQNLNGREISNAIHTARTIARFEETRVQIKHLQSVLAVRAKFDDSLKVEGKKATRGASHDEPRKILRQGSIIEEPEEM